MPDAQRQKAVQLYLRGDMSAEDIATEVGVSRATLYNWLNAEGVVGGRRHQPTATGEAGLLEQILANQLRFMGDIEALTRAEGSIKDELADMGRTILDNQTQFMGEISACTVALGGLKAEQESVSGGWMALIQETRKDVAAAEAALRELQKELAAMRSEWPAQILEITTAMTELRRDMNTMMSNQAGNKDTFVDRLNSVEVRLANVEGLLQAVLGLRQQKPAEGDVRLLSKPEG